MIRRRIFESLIREKARLSPMPSGVSRKPTMAEKPPSGLPMIEGAPPGAFEEVRRGDTQNARRFQQSAGADSIGALLVLLDLLKGYAEVFAELLLTHAQRHAAQPHPTSNVDVDRVGSPQFQVHLAPRSNISPTYPPNFGDLPFEQSNPYITQYRALSYAGVSQTLARGSRALLRLRA